ncbi:MAG: TetR/AcrR family transcriptional regulator [Veillonella sp.]|nr:TetR/AcrR family transcriptional regulator [Veillonella sp.]
MDRRQKKTRKAIFIAFNKLLSNKAYDKITVQEIISAADIGRTTFYAHFDTKEALLEALCEDLFLHIKDSINHLPHAHGLYQQSIYPVSVFGHLLQHLQQNENKILELLASDNNEIFLRYINHISGSFVEMVLWWVKNGMKESPTELDNYFHAVIEPII